jgi:hypothetical protein
MAKGKFMSNLIIQLKAEAKNHKRCGAYGLEKLFNSAANHIEKLEEAIHYSTDYLDHNKLNSIGNGSKAHNELKQALKRTPNG